VGIGIASGEVFAGAGSRPRGEAMHVAAALAAAAPPGEILLGDATRALAGATLRGGPVAPIAVRGRRSEVAAWRLDEIAPEAPAPQDGPFVAREPELAALRAAQKAAADDGSCRRTTVVGPAGIGKSRLARELLAELGDAVGVARCRASAGAGAASAFAALVRAVAGAEPEAWIRSRLGADERVEAIARSTSAVLAGSDAPAQPGEIAWAVRRVLEAAAQERPLVVVVEDAHRADPALLDFVEYLLGFAGAAPILLLCLGRPELLDLRPAWATPRPESALLVLDPLGPDAARALLDARDAGLDAAAAASIVATAEGNPLFLEQLLAVRAEGEPTTLPPTIEAVLAARIDRLEPREREVLRHASPEGRRFHARAVAELLPATERDVLDRALLGLVQKQLIRRARPEFAGEDAFRFSHALIRDAAYAGLPKRLRGEHHERLAGWLRARPLVRDELVGFHLEQACRLRRELGAPDAHDRALAGEAADRLAAAAQAELRRGDAAAAARLLERAVALVPSDDPARAGLLISLGATLVDAGRLADADAHLGVAIAQAERDGDPRTAARGRVELELERQHAGRSPGGAAALAVADAALAELERHGDDLGRCRAWRLRAWTEWAASRAEAADAAWRQAAELARLAGDERELYEILGWRASAAAFGPTPVIEAIDRCERFRAEAAASPVAVAFVLHPLGLLHAMTGEFEHARALVTEANAILAELGRMEQAVSHHEAQIEMLAGRLETTEERLRSGYEALERMGEHAVLATTAADLARVVLEQGRDAEAAALCAASERLAAPEDVATQAMWRGVRARLLAGEGEPARAEALAREAVALIDPTDLLNDRADVLLDLAAVLYRGGRAEEAGRIRERAIALYEAKGNRISAARARAWPAPRSPA
jgi:tetratricopeptide (TPR) repeat protein